MEKYIIFIILIIFVLIILSKKNENLMIDDLKSNAINTVVGKFITNQKTKLPNINISSSLKVNNIDFSKLILDFKYPIGSFYIQYPDSNINFSSRGDREVSPFPESKTPAKMFGGNWVDMWKNESVYFRTGNGEPILNSPAFEDIYLCDPGVNGYCKTGADRRFVDSRVDGLQDYAVRDISGWTSWSQGPYGNHDTIPYGQCITPDGPDRDSKCDLESTGPKSCFGNTGVFTKCEQKEIGTDGGGGDDTGHQNIFDTKEFLKEKYTSDNEVRVKNRLIKVWKRIG